MLLFIVNQRLCYFKKLLLISVNTKNHFISPALALQHLRMEHLSHALETNTAEDYQKLSQDFGDHIIEYLSEDTNEVIRIHSIL